MQGQITGVEIDQFTDDVENVDGSIGQESAGTKYMDLQVHASGVCFETCVCRDGEQHIFRVLAVRPRAQLCTRQGTG